MRVIEFLEQVRLRYPDDLDKVRRMSLIEETPIRSLRTANLACVGAHSINGVSELHTELLKEELFHDFCDMWPEKFNNKTNGVTPRRFLLLANPKLSELISSKIGESWITNLYELKKLESFQDDLDFQNKWRQIKLTNKQNLASLIHDKTGIIVSPDSLFDMQVKRIHEYKRQHLNLLHIITLYHQIKENPSLDIVPRTFIFAGKAAPGYFLAKLIIKLINSVGEVINHDPDVHHRLKVDLFPNFNVKNGQRIYPGGDLSEQISTAGTEASGTGNMKFAMNGALTIGTYDGANIEIMEEVGEENFFLFGLKAQEIEELKIVGYNPIDYYNMNSELKKSIDLISSGAFSKGNPNLFKPIVDSLMTHDPFMVFADYQAYIDCQKGL